MNVEIFPMGAFQVNSYLLQCEETGAIAVIDPGDEPGILLDRLALMKGKPEILLNTHGHIDHVSGNAAILRKYNIPALLHPEDIFLVREFAEQAAYFGLRLEAPPPPSGPLVPGEPVTFGACRLEVYHTPGHSPGSVTFVHGAQAISGDVIFAGSIGRTDLPRADLATLMRSIDEVFTPHPEWQIFPGHGPTTSVRAELKSNPFLQREWRSEMLRHQG